MLFVAAIEAAHKAEVPMPVRILINSKVSGAVIGRAGARIKQVAAMTQTKCSCVNEVIDIYGPGTLCTKAVEMFLETMVDFQNSTKEQRFVLCTLHSI